MGTYVVKDPDTGKTYKVEADSAEQAYADVDEFLTGVERLQQRPETATATPENASGPSLPLGPEGTTEALKTMPGRTWGAAGTALTRPAQYLKQALGMDPGDVSGQRSLAQASPLGAIAGDVITTAIPGMKAEQAAQAAVAASKLPKVLKQALKPGVSAGVGATLGGAAPTLPGESKVEQMLEPAALAGGLNVGGKVLSRALTQPIRPSAEAKQLIAQGVQPTAGRGGRGIMGKIAEYAEGVADVVPGLGIVTQKGAQRAKDEVLEAAGKQVAPPGVKAGTPDRKDFFTDLQDEFDDQYTNLLGGKTIKSGAFLRTAATKAGMAELTLVPNSLRAKLEADIERLVPRGRKVDGLAYKEGHDAIRQEARRWALKASKTDSKEAAEMARAYRAVDSALTQNRNLGLTPDDIKVLDVLDDKFDKMLVLERAVARPGKDQLRNLIAEVEAVTPAADKVRGMGPFQDLTEPAKKILDTGSKQDILGRKIGYGVAGTALGGGALATGTTAPLGAALIASGAGATRPGSKLALGQYGWQDKLRAIIRGLRGRAGTGAAIADQE